jgi:hypothetical protein
MVNVGIFWVIRGKVYYKLQEKDENAIKNITNKIDSDYGHFYEWDGLCGKLYPHADFATFPRGRVLYDMKERTHIVYRDECITEEELKKVIEAFNLKEYKTLTDEHYSCDKCIKRKGDLFL